MYNVVTNSYFNFFYCSVNLGKEVVFHLHGFIHQKFLTTFNHITFFDEYLHDSTRQWSASSKASRCSLTRSGFGLGSTLGAVPALGRGAALKVWTGSSSLCTFTLYSLPSTTTSAFSPSYFFTSTAYSLPFNVNLNFSYRSYLFKLFNPYILELHGE